MKFNVLGPLQVADGATMLTPTAPKLRTVLSLLIVNYRRVVPIDTLVEEIWLENPPVSAVTTLQTYVYQLRRAFARHPWVNVDDVLLTRPLGYEAAIDPDDIDLHVFERQARLGREQLQAGQVEAAAQSLHSALDSWQGAALADVRRGPLLEALATYLDESMLEVLVLRIEADLQLGRHRELISELRQLTAQHPLYEDLYAKLMVALYRSNWRSAALATYHDLRRTLDEELGLAPSPGLQRLHHEILSDMPSLQYIPEPRTTATATATLVTPAQLPPEISDFVGRENELATIAAGLTKPSRAPRLIVVDGPVGVGKSVLAARAAHEARALFPDGQLFADLGGGVEPSEVLAGFLRAIGITGTDIPDALPDRARLFRSWSADRAGLMLLDGAVSAAQVLPLLPSGPDWAVLITSRPTLTGLAGAVRFRLGLPPVGEGVELLGNALGRHRIDAELDEAAAIVRLCGRLPLAVRAAGQCLDAAPHWRLKTLRDRLTTRTGRLAALSTEDDVLRSRLASVFQMLTPADQAIVERLAVARDLHFDRAGVATLLRVESRATEDILHRLVAINVLEVVTSEDRDDQFRMPLLFSLYVRERLGGHRPVVRLSGTVPRSVNVAGTRLAPSGG